MEDPRHCGTVNTNSCSNDLDYFGYPHDLGNLRI